MDEVCVNVFFAQRGADCELDARNYVSLRLNSVFAERAVVFSIFMSHLIPLFTVVSGIRQMGLKCSLLSGRIGEPCTEQSIAHLIGATFQLRSLRVVTQ
jgi:hypothetical protein